ncbi:hypothetical protein [Nitrospira sp. BLG_2]|uniref:hypothetical protein n=1 Tax=Nitrospira sp. BLG_2 TaxID=3397507 RepID=UPI003B9A9B18
MLLKMFNHDEQGTLIHKLCKDVLELNEAITQGWATAPHLIGKKAVGAVEDVAGKKDKKDKEA